MQKPKCGPSLIAGGILVLTATLLIFFVGVPAIIKGKVKEEIKLKNGSDTWNKWKDIPIPVYLTFYFFHVLNPKAIEHGEKFHLLEKGPYVYEEKRHKEILEVNQDNDTVTYREFIQYYFREDLSLGNKDTDLVSVVNIPFVAVSSILKKILYGLANIPIDLLWKGGERFVRENVSVKDLVFDGIDTSIYTPLLNLQPGLVPPEFQGGTFAFYKNRNGSSDGNFTIKSGLKDHSTFGNIVQYNDMSELTYWTDPDLKPYQEQYCNKINGSDGTIIPPFLDKDRVVYIFNTDVCRSLYLTFDRETKFEGIPGYRFTAPQKLTRQPSQNPDNKCFCPSPGGGLADHCNMSGIFRVFPCRGGAPIVLSLPHFLDGDSIFIEGVEGVKPNPELHETFLEAEPTSGQVLQAKKRIQVNMEMEPLDGISLFRNISGPSYVVPVFWVEEVISFFGPMAASLDQANIQELKDRLIRPLNLVKIFQWTLIALSILLILAEAGNTVLVHRAKRN